MKFPINDFFSKCDHIHRKLQMHYERKCVTACMYMCVCRSVCMCSFHVLYYFPLELEGQGLYALNVKSTELILQIGCPSYHLTSWRKPVLFQCIKYVGRYQLCNYLIAVDCLHQLLDALTAPFQCSFD